MHKQSVAELSTAADRRRPGRMVKVDNALLPLMREQQQSIEEEPARDLSTRASIGICLILSAVSWALITGLSWTVYVATSRYW